MKAVKMFAGISSLDLAMGIKQLLEAHGFSSLDALLKLPTAELALILGIDMYIARLIYMTAKKHASLEQEQFALNDEAFVKLDQKARNEHFRHLSELTKHVLHI